MNKIYKVVWSKTRNCYVVASEFAKRYSGKSATGMNREHGGVFAMSAFLAALILTAGIFVAPDASAAGPEETGIKISGVNSKGQVIASQTATEPKGGTKAILLYDYKTPENTYSVLDEHGQPLYSNKRTYGVELGHHTSTADKYNNGYTSGVAVGDYAQSNGGLGVAVGTYAQSKDIGAIALGTATLAKGFNSMAAMRQASATGSYSAAIGTSAYAKGSGAFAIGSSATATGDHSLAIGSSVQKLHKGQNGVYYSEYSADSVTRADGNRSIAMGSKARAIGTNSEDSIAIGTEAEVNSSVAAKKQAVQSVAIGKKALAANNNTVAVGAGTGAYAVDGIAIGHNAQSGVKGNNKVWNSIAIGNDSSAEGGSAISLGNDNWAKADSSISLGNASRAMSNSSTAIGHNAHADGVQSIAAGREAVTKGTSAVAMGDLSAAIGDGSVAIGQGSKVGAATYKRSSSSTDGYHVDQIVSVQATKSVTNGVALGNMATVNHDNSVALGAGAVTAAKVGTASMTINGSTKNFAGTNPIGTVSVGTTGTERTITNVAAGRVTAGSTDAINGSQLYGVVSEVNKGVVYAADKGSAFTQQLGETTTIKGGAKSLTENNIGVESNGSDTLTVKLAKDITGLNSVTTTNATISNATINNATIGGNTTINSSGITTNKITGLQTNNITNNSDAVNVEYLKKYVNESGQGKMDSFKVQSNSDAATKITNNETVKFVDGKNTTVKATETAEGAVVTVNTADDVSFNSVTTKSATIGGKVAINNTGINMNGLGITNLKSGGDIETNAANIGDVKKAVSTATTTITNNLTTKGMNFRGDAGVQVHRDLGETLNIKGGAQGALTENNIAVTGNGDTLHVQLAKNVTGLNNIVTNNAVINNSATIGGNTTITNNGITTNNVTTNRVTGLVTNNITNNSDAVNVEYLKKYVTNNAGTGTMDKFNVQSNDDQANPISNNQTVKFVDGTNTEVSAVGTAEGATVTVDLKDVVSIGDQANTKVTIDGTTGTIATGEVRINGGTINTVTGLSNRTWDINNPTIVNGRAATEDQLGVVSNQVKTNTTNITNINDKVNKGWQANVNGTKLKDVTPNSRVVNYKEGKNVKVTGSGDDITVATADDVNFNKVTTNETIINNSATIGGNTVINSGGVTTNNVTANKVVTTQVTGLQTNKIVENSDAVNVEYLKKYVDNKTEGKGTMDSFNVQGNDGPAAKITNKETVKFVDGTSTKVTVAESATGAMVAVDLKDVVSIGDQANTKVTIDGTTGTIATGEVRINGGTTNTVTGLSNRTWDINNPTIVNGRAATEDQLGVVSNQVKTNTTNITNINDTVNKGWQANVNGAKLKDVTPNSRVVNYKEGKNVKVTGSGDDITVATADDVNFTSVTVGAGTNEVILNTAGVTVGGKTYISGTGINANGQKITNVKAGESALDAVNYSQLMEVKTQAGKSVKVGDGKNTNVTSKVEGDITTYNVNLNDDVTLGADVAKQIAIMGSEGTITAGAVSINGVEKSITAGTVKIDGAKNVVGGLSNKTWDVKTSVPVDGQAATENQLKSVSDAVNTNTTNITNINDKVNKGWQANVNGEKVKDVTPNDRVLNFKDGKNIALSSEDGEILIATKEDVNFTSVNVGTGANAVLINAAGVNVGGKTYISGAGINANGQKITNVKAGETDLDAVNYSQLMEVKSIANKTTAVAAGKNLNVASKTEGDVTTYTVSLNDKVVLGTGDKAVTVDGTSGVINTGNTSITSAGMTITNANPDKTVSLTDSGLNNGGNRIVNVAKGEAATDAVNVSQLNEATAKATTKVEGSSNVVVTSKVNPDKSVTYGVDLAKTVTIGDADKAVTIDGTKALVTAGSGEKSVAIDGNSGIINVANGGVVIDGAEKSVITGDIKIDGKTNTITGLSNKEWDGTNYVSGRAATEDQLKKAADLTETKITNISNQLIEKGMNFAANDGAPVHTNLGGTLGIKGGGTKGNENYSTKNIKTIAGADGISIALDKDLTVDTVSASKSINVGAEGNNSKAGTDGTTGIALDGENGTIGITGKAGADGKMAHVDIGVAGGKSIDGKDITNLTYNDGNNSYTVATRDDGMTFKGDNDKVITKKLNEQVEIVGGAKDISTARNIAVTGTDDGKLQVDLAKNVSGVESVKVGLKNNVTMTTGEGMVVRKGTETITTYTSNGLVAQNNKTGDRLVVSSSEMKLYPGETSNAGGGVGPGGRSLRGTEGSGLRVRPADGGTTASIGIDAAGMSNGYKQIHQVASGFDPERVYATDADYKAVNLGDLKTWIHNGIQFGANTVENPNENGAIRISLDKTLNIVGGGTEADDRYDASNIKTIASTDADGNGKLEVRLAKDLKADSLTINDSTVKLSSTGLDNGGNKIVNVAAGEVSPTSTDAVNGSQLYETNQRIDKVGAGAAALAGLHPLQYDPLAPTQIMAAVGNAGNQTAAALGVAHYTNENTLFHLGASIGGSKNMVNAGVTYKFGTSDDKKAIPDRYKAGPISSVYVMQDEVSALKAENERIKAREEQLTADYAQLQKDNEETKAKLNMLMQKLGM